MQPTDNESVEGLRTFRDNLSTILTLLQSTGTGLRMQFRAGLEADRAVMLKAQEMCVSLAAMMPRFRSEYLVYRSAGAKSPEATRLLAEIGSGLDQITNLLPIVGEAVERALPRATSNLLADSGFGAMFDQQVMARVMGNGVSEIVKVLSHVGRCAFTPAMAACAAGMFIDPKLVVAFGETILPLDAGTFLDPANDPDKSLFLGHALAFQRGGATACAMVFEAGASPHGSDGHVMDTLVLSEEATPGTTVYVFSISPERDPGQPRVLHLFRQEGPAHMPAGAAFLRPVNVERTPNGGRMPTALRRSIERVAAQVGRTIDFVKNHQGTD